MNTALLPERVAVRLDAASGALTTVGAGELLHFEKTAVFCSETLPPDLALPLLDRAAVLAAGDRAVASGFHSPAESAVLEILLEGGCPIIVFAARGLASFRPPRTWSAAIDAGRMLIVSPFPKGARRPTGAMAAARNRLAAASADDVFIAHATAAGRLHRLAREIARRGQRLCCFDHPANEDLLLLGAEPLPPHQHPVSLTPNP